MRNMVTLQKKAVRSILNTKYNAHTSGLFYRLKILKIQDQLTYNRLQLLFSISLGTHPGNISNIFTRSLNFDRTLQYIPMAVKYSNITKQAPTTLVSTWNALPAGYKGWLKEFPTQSSKRAKNILEPNRVISGNELNLNKFRLKGVKDSFLQTTLSNYKNEGKCNNKTCTECFVPV